MSTHGAVRAADRNRLSRFEEFRMNRQRFPRERDPQHESREDLRDYRGVQSGAYGRYDEDDWQPRSDWGYGDGEAERGPAAPYYGGRGDGGRYRTPDAQRGDYAAHYGAGED